MGISHIFILSSVDGHMSCCHIWLLWVMLLWIFMHNFWHGHIFSIIFCYTNNEIAGLYGKFIFNNLHVFQSDCNILYSNKVWGFQYPHRYNNSCYCLSFFFFFFIAILVDLKWYFIVGLICNFPMANYIEHLFMSFFAILYILWRSVYSNPLPLF